MHTCVTVDVQVRSCVCVCVCGGGGGRGCSNDLVNLKDMLNFMISIYSTV